MARSAPFRFRKDGRVRGMMMAQLPVGTRIYRPARLRKHGNGVQVVVATPTLKDFGDGTTMIRAVPDAAYLPNWLAVPWEDPGGRVCVCDEPVPENWTYFEVFFEDVNFVAVSPIAGDLEELKQVHRAAWRHTPEREPDSPA
jgi:hypothetical protein